MTRKEGHNANSPVPFGTEPFCEQTCRHARDVKLLIGEGPGKSMPAEQPNTELIQSQRTTSS